MLRGLALICVAACGERGAITARAFTVTPTSGGSCILVADLVSDRDSSNVDLTIAACSGSRCSARSSSSTEGPFVPGRAKTVELDLASCPDHPDRIDIAVSRWGSRNSALSSGAIDHFEKSPGDTQCRVDSVLRMSEQFGDTTMFLVARDAASRPLDRTLPFVLPKTAAPQPHADTFRVPCSQIATVELQVVD